MVCIGGVQAIGAFAYGAGDIPKVDTIVGPGAATCLVYARKVHGMKFVAVSPLGRGEKKVETTVLIVGPGTATCLVCSSHEHQ